MLLLSAATAHARPTFELDEPGARAGDAVHFSILGAAASVTYELEIGDKDVLEGTGGGDVVSGTFTMPDLGDGVRTVTVEAEIRTAGKRKKAKEKLDYLGPAVPVTAPPAGPAPVEVPAVTPQAPSSPQPVTSPKTLAGASPAPLLAPQPGQGSGKNRRPRQSRKRHAPEQRRHTDPRGERRVRANRGRTRRHDAARKRARSQRRAPRTAPLFDGIPEPGAGAKAEGESFSALNAIAPRTAALAATRSLRHADGPSPAIVVPALLGLAALALAGTAVLRRRRLAARSARH